MKIMQISVNVDVCNEDHVKALEVFTRALGGLSPVSEVVTTTAAPVKIEIEEKPKAVRPSRAKAKPEPEPEPETEEEETEETEQDLLGDDEAEEELVIDSVMLRALTAPKSTTHRDVIKAKLAELGANNVSTIPEDKYKEYHDFITSL